MFILTPCKRYVHIAQHKVETPKVKKFLIHSSCLLFALDVIVAYFHLNHLEMLGAYAGKTAAFGAGLVAYLEHVPAFGGDVATSSDPEDTDPEEVKV